MADALHRHKHKHPFYAANNFVVGTTQSFALGIEQNRLAIQRAMTMSERDRRNFHRG